jgi:hypothetical protein
LNPQGEKADAETLPGADALRTDILGICLEGYPGAVLNRKILPGGRQDARDVLRRER